MLLQELDVETLLDAACGDFNWMSHVELGPVSQIGVDVVPDLIDRNLRLYEDKLRRGGHQQRSASLVPHIDAVINSSIRALNALLPNCLLDSTARALSSVDSR